MSSSVSSTLSAGAELLAHNYSTLVPGPSGADVGSTAADQNVSKTRAATPVHSSSVVSGSVTSPDGDTVEFSAEALQLLQLMGDSGSASHSASHATQAYSAASAYQGIDFFG